MDERKLREELKKLIEKFERVKAEGKYKKYNEENTKKDFILPLFRALGWNVENSDEVKAEEKVSKKRVDYAFRINGIPKFFLEAKPLRKFVSEPKYAKQAIEYAWNKSVTWAILCNFEGIRVFNAEWEWNDKQPMRNQFLDLRYDDYLGSCFKYLTWLSRESFEQNVLDKQATILGKKVKKLPIGRQLLVDFTEHRESLTKDILKNNQKMELSQDDFDEIVQRILDRIIFIRTCEDKEIESEKLESLVRIYGEKEGNLYKELNKKFREYDNGYNSKLFFEHLCEKVVISNDVLNQVILGTYQSRSLDIKYDFSAIDADVLGNIYEQYLGHILKSTAKRAKITNGKVHRKEQGIYYTPTHIVDYIVRNTLGEKLKKRNVKVDELKILDPACGSGSFLLKTFDILSEYITKKEGRIQQTRFEDAYQGSSKLLKRKTEILKNCIFGVDLDVQAVEITQLNLLLKLAEKRQRLPTLQENIKCGNSLIDNYELIGDKAFNYQEKFKKISDLGGFDIIIGNPPYVIYTSSEIPRKILEYYQKKYLSCQYNISSYSLFLELGIKLLKENGYLGFIIPDSFLVGQFYYKLREVILSNCQIKSILMVDKNVFEDVTVKSVIIILKKENNKAKRSNNKIILLESKKEGGLMNLETSEIKQAKYYKNDDLIFTIGNSLIQNIVERVQKNSVSLEKIVDFFAGLKTDDNKNMISTYIKDHFETQEAIFNTIEKRKEIKNWQEKLRKCYKTLDAKKIFSKISQDNKNLSKLWHPILRGSDINQYLIKFVDRYVLYIPNLLKSGFDKSKYQQEKIIIRQTGDSLIASYDNENYFSMNNTHLILQKSPDFDLKYILGILNSNLMNFYYHYIVPEKGRTFAEVKIVNLKKLKIRVASKETQNAIVNLVNESISLNKRLNKIGDKKTDARAQTEEEIKMIDEKINKLVYKLYGLTKEEIAIVEESLKE